MAGRSPRPAADRAAGRGHRPGSLSAGPPGPPDFSPDRGYRRFLPSGEFGFGGLRRPAQGILPAARVGDIVEWGGVRILTLSLWTLAVTLVILALVFVIIYKTRIGLAMRAVSRDMETVSLMGVPVNRVISLTFALGSALAAAGGILWAMKYPQLTP